MTDIDPNERPIAPEEVWDRIRANLCQPQVLEDSASGDIPALAGLFDALTIVERDFVASKMIATLSDCFSQQSKFEAIHYSILALVEPYINLSNYQSEARLLLAGEFGGFRSRTRDFKEYFELGLALASLSYRAAGSSGEWEGFYETYSGDPSTRYQALDVALGGTSETDIRGFAKLIDQVPPDDRAVERLFSYFPTLVQCHQAREVEQLVADFIERVDDDELKADLIDLASQYGLTIRRDNGVLRSIPLGSPIPSELSFAHGLIENEERRGIQRQELSAALERRAITVIRSNYTEIPLVRAYQTEVLELVEDLNGKSDVFAMDSETFDQLLPEISGRRKVVFAFPTYLTASKQDMGYSVCGIGYHHRLGVLYPDDNRLSKSADRPKTLSSLLKEVRRNNGSILCLENYAIPEIVRQEAEKDPELEGYFNGSHLIVMPAIVERGSAVPVPRFPKNSSLNIAFVYDLAGQQFIQDKVKAQRRALQKRYKWLWGARTDIIEHDLTVPVGIAFTKYLVKWLLDNDHWAKMVALAAQWSQRSDFQTALTSLGIDPAGVSRQLAKLPDGKSATALRIV